MNDVDLDDLLRKSAPEPSASAAELAVQLAQELRGADVLTPALKVRRRRRRNRVVAGAVGTLLMTAGATVAAYQLSVPPFQTLPDGVQRAHAGIPVTYTNSLGRQVECLAFIEYRNMDENQRAAIEAVAEDPRWEGYGDRVLATLNIPDASPIAQNDAISDVVHEDLRAAAREAVPEIVFPQDIDLTSYDAGDPFFNGSAFSCPEGVDGLP